MAQKTSVEKKKKSSAAVRTAQQIAACQGVLPFSLTGSLEWLLRSLTDNNNKTKKALIGLHW